MVVGRGEREVPFEIGVGCIRPSGWRRSESGRRRPFKSRWRRPVRGRRRRRRGSLLRLFRRGRCTGSRTGGRAPRLILRLEQAQQKGEQVSWWLLLLLLLLLAPVWRLIEVRIHPLVVWITLAHADLRSPSVPCFFTPLFDVLVLLSTQYCLSSCRKQRGLLWCYFFLTLSG